MTDTVHRTYNTIRKLTGQSSSWSLLVGLIFVVLASLVAWVFSPKGDNQTYSSPSAWLIGGDRLIRDNTDSGGARLFSRLRRVILCGVCLPPAVFFLLSFLGLYTVFFCGWMEES